MPLLVIAFIVVPLAELAVILKVGGAIGVLNTIGVLLAVSVLGAWLVKREGLAVYRRIRDQIDAGRMPGTDLLDAFMILAAGALLLTPGFLTDVVGLLLLLPPVRAFARRGAGAIVIRRLRLR